MKKSLLSACFLLTFSFLFAQSNAPQVQLQKMLLDPQLSELLKDQAISDYLKSKGEAGIKEFDYEFYKPLLPTEQPTTPPIGPPIVPIKPPSDVDKQKYQKLKNIMFELREIIDKKENNYQKRAESLIVEVSDVLRKEK